MIEQKCGNCQSFIPDELPESVGPALNTIETINEFLSSLDETAQPIKVVRFGKCRASFIDKDNKPARYDMEVFSEEGCRATDSANNPLFKPK